MVVFKKLKTSNIKSSKYKGVYKCLKTKQYYSKIVINKRCYIRYFNNEIDAANKYDEMLLNHNPSSKKTNFPKKIYFKNNKLKRPVIKEYEKNIVCSRQKNNCNLCKESLDTDRIIDHIIPRYLEGKDNINNYQALCGKCNKWKTHDFDFMIKEILFNQKNIPLDIILKIQESKFTKHMGKYPIISNIDESSFYNSICSSINSFATAFSGLFK
jgi:hypothetical protein